MNEHMIEAWQEFHAHEMDVGATKFERFADKVEKLLGLDPMPGLDGHEDVDGYSLDGAVDAMTAGMTPKEYAESVKRKIAALKAGAQ